VAVDPKWLRAKAAQWVVIEEDRPCRHCEYNLRGLKAVGNCPECGTPIDAELHASTSISDQAKTGKRWTSRFVFIPYTRLPMPELKRMAIATSTMYVGALVLMVALAVAWWTLFAARVGLADVDASHFGHVFLFGALPGSVLWWLGCMMLMIPRSSVRYPHPTGRDIVEHELGVEGHAGLNKLSAISQILLPVSIGLAAASGFVGGFANSAESTPYITLAGACAVIASVSAAPVFMVLRNIAQWVNDDSAYYKFSTCLFGMALGAIWIGVTPLFNELVGVFFGLIGMLLTGLVFFVAAIVPFTWVSGLHALSAACRWAPRNQHDAEEQERRFVEKARLRQQRADAIREARGGDLP